MVVMVERSNCIRRDRVGGRLVVVMVRRRVDEDI